MEIYVWEPILNFVKSKHKKEDVKADTGDFQDILKKLRPITVNHFEIANGEVHYIDNFSYPHVELAMTNISVKAYNLSNVNDSNKILPSTLVVEADVYDGKFNMTLNFNALEKQPTFDLNAQVKALNMLLLNDFFKAYGKFDVNKGTFTLYTEFAAKDGYFNGYVKPLIKDLDVLQWNEDGPIKQKIWDAMIGGVAEIFENQKKVQLSSKITIEGKFQKPNTELWTAINYVLRNAFVFGLRPSIDNTINIKKVEEEKKEKKTFLQKIFGKDKDNKKGASEKDKAKNASEKDKVKNSSEKGK